MDPVLVKRIYTSVSILLLLLSWTSSTTSAAIYPDLDLSTLAPTEGFELVGGVAVSTYPFTVSNAGDVNADGLPDMIMGAYAATPHIDPTRVQAGVTYVFYGRSGSFDPQTNLNLITTGPSTGFRIYGAFNYDNSGKSVAGAGDVNGDGVDDFLISANLASPPPIAGTSITYRNGAGIVYVIFGRNFLLDGAFSDVDLLTTFASNSFAGYRIFGVTMQTNVGNSVSGAGDINHDGINDILISSHLADSAPNSTVASSRPYGGISYVVFGAPSSTSIAPSPVDLLTFRNYTTKGFRILGARTYDWMSYSVSGGSGATRGDINGDGVDDVILGAFQALATSGVTYVVFGRHVNATTPPFTQIDLLTFDHPTHAGFRIIGAKENDFSGYSVKIAGDVNGDGVSDILVGAWAADPPAINFVTRGDAGMTYVVFGRKLHVGEYFGDVHLSTITLTTGSTVGFVILGAFMGDNSGCSVSGAGDLNGDHIDDIIVGANYANPPALGSSNHAGIAYVIFGRRSDYSNIDLNSYPVGASTGYRILGAVAQGTLGYSVSGVGDVNGDGFGDVIISGWKSVGSGSNNVPEAVVVFGAAAVPTSQPSSAPSAQPSVQPSTQPSRQPSSHPSCQPSAQPSVHPSAQPVAYPTSRPSVQPSSQPSRQPVSVPTSQPSTQPLSHPTAQPSIQPSAQPSTQPVGAPTSQPSTQPVSGPTSQPSLQPSAAPSTQPTSVPSCIPTSQPSSVPSVQPSGQPTTQPSGQPSSLPTSAPSSQPSVQPSMQPSSAPSTQPSSVPSAVPSTQPSAVPSTVPSSRPSVQPSGQPSAVPTAVPSTQPSAVPSVTPTSSPSVQPSRIPSVQPSPQPSSVPSVQPSAVPSTAPTTQPSSVPSSQPSVEPSQQPSTYPSSQPSTVPSVQPSHQPTTHPSSQPTTIPSVYPTTMPSSGWSSKLDLLSVVSSVSYVGGVWSNSVWVCGVGNTAATASCVLVDGSNGDVYTQYVFSWDSVMSVLSTSDANSVIITSLSTTTMITSAVSSSVYAQCRAEASTLTCTSKAFHDVTFQSASYVPYPNKLAYVGWYNIHPTIIILDVFTSQLQSYIYTAYNMKSLVFSQVQSPPNFVGSFVAGSCVRSVGVPTIFIVTGLLRTDNGVVSGMNLSPVSGTIMNSGVELVNAMELEVTGPDSFIAGGLQLSDGSSGGGVYGMHGYLLRVNALYNTIQYCVRYRDANLVHRRKLSAVTEASSVVRGMVLYDSALYMILEYRDYSANAVPLKSISLLKVNSATGAIVEQLHIVANHANITCTDITNTELYVYTVCNVHNTTHTYPVLLRTTLDLFVSTLPHELYIQNTTLHAESIPFQRSVLQFTTTPTSMQTTDSTVDTTDQVPTRRPSLSPTYTPSTQPSSAPSAQPSSSPSAAPSVSARPTSQPSSAVPTITHKPSAVPTVHPTERPTTLPTARPTVVPTVAPTTRPSAVPTPSPSRAPSVLPTVPPTRHPTTLPSTTPRTLPTLKPTPHPTHSPTQKHTDTNHSSTTNATPRYIIGLSVGGGLCIVFVGFVAYKYHQHQKEEKDRKQRWEDFCAREAAALAAERQVRIRNSHASSSGSDVSDGESERSDVSFEMSEQSNVSVGRTRSVERVERLKQTQTRGAYAVSKSLHSPTDSSVHCSVVLSSLRSSEQSDESIFSVHNSGSGDSQYSANAAKTANSEYHLQESVDEYSDYSGIEEDVYINNSGSGSGSVGESTLSSEVDNIVNMFMEDSSDGGGISNRSYINSSGSNRDDCDSHAEV